MDPDVVEIPLPIHQKPCNFKKQKQVSNYSSFSIQKSFLNSLPLLKYCYFSCVENLEMKFMFKVVSII
jgi:hypothetical protein